MPFFTNKKYVFQSVTDTRAAFWRELYMFYGARAVTYFLELAIMEGGNHFFATVNGEIVTWRSLVVKVVAQVVILVLNYISANWSFSRKRKRRNNDVFLYNPRRLCAYCPCDRYDWQHCTGSV